MLAKHKTAPTFRLCPTCDGDGGNCTRCKGAGEAVFCQHCGEPEVGDDHCRCPQCGELACRCEEQIRADEESERARIRDDYR